MQHGKLTEGFLLNRFGSNVLMSQYLALVLKTHGPHGIVDPNCNAGAICRESAKAVQDICHDYTGRRPVVIVETRSCATSQHVDKDGAPNFPYIPGALRYIMCELLKNSCRATIEACTTEEELKSRPIRVVVCADDYNVAICTSDQAGGIPFDVGSQVWSYLYSTARKKKVESPDSNPHTAHAAKKAHDGATELAGYGVGLPISRLYARYLGGSLDLISLPGYGTHAYLFLPRISANQQEVVPDRDANYTYHTLGEFALGSVGSVGSLGSIAGPPLAGQPP